MEVYQLVGIEKREYEIEGVMKNYCALHFVSASGSESDVIGSVVLSISCPKEVNPDLLDVGVWYEFIYKHFRTKDGIKARLVDLKHVEV